MFIEISHKPIFRRSRCQSNKNISFLPLENNDKTFFFLFFYDRDIITRLHEYKKSSAMALLLFILTVE